MRILCVAAGVGIFLAVGWATLSDEYARYQTTAIHTPISVPVPDRLLAPVSAPRGAENREGRLFLYLVAANVEGGTGTPVRVAPVELDWPRQRGQEVEGSFDYEQVHYAISVKPLELVREAPLGSDPASTPTLVMHATVTGKVRGPGYRGDFPSSGLYDLRGQGIVAIQANRPAIRLLSLNASPQPELELWCLGVLAAPDSAVHEAPFSKARADYGPNLFSASVPRAGAHFIRGRFVAAGRMPMRGVALFVMKEFPALLLLLGAGLLCKWFRARSLAFAVLVFVAVLYIAALDRATLAVDLGKLRDRTAPVETRLAACENARWTFFYRATARKTLTETSERSSEPVALREAAARAATELAG